MALVDDDFTTLDQWTQTSPTASIVSGKLRCDANDAYAWSGGAAEADDTIDAPFDIRVDFDVATLPASGQWEFGLSLGMGTAYKTSVTINNVSGYIGSIDAGDYLAYAATSDTSGKFRITCDDVGNYETFYWGGSDWVSLVSGASPVYASRRPTLWCIRETASQRMQIDFDNLDLVTETVQFDCPTAAGVDLSLFSTEMYDALMGCPTAAAIPYFIATPQRHELSVPTAGAVPDFHAYSDPVVTLSVPTAAVIPMFSAKTGRVASFAIPTAAAIPAMTAKVGRVASFSVPTASAIPSFDATVHGFAVMTIPTAAAIPAFESYGTAVTIAANLLTKGIAEYTNYNFDSFFNYQGQYYGLAGGVIYLLSGTTDAGTAISSYIAGGRGVFGYDQLKTVTDVFLLSNVNGGADLTLYADDSAAGQTYTLTGDGTVASRRFKCALGVRGHEWRWKLANKAGSTFDVRRLELLFDMKVRR